MESLEATVALARAPGLHAGQLRDKELLNEPQRLVGRSVAALCSLGLRPAAAAWLANPDPQQLSTDCLWVRNEGLQLLRWGSPDYPARVAAIDDAPAVLFVRGAPANLLRPQLAIVGSRHPTAAGLRTAEDFAAWLAAAGMVVTSGLARGIDAAAHQGALQRGHTIAVVGTGLDSIYPPENRTLHERILEGGGSVVSELPRGTPPLAQNFPHRNRLISALSIGTLVVEAARNSGSLITARLAGTQGRQVFVVPGSIHNPQSHGCHTLIRDGATLVESAAQILEDLQIHFDKQSVINLQTPPESPADGTPLLDKAYEILLDAVGFDPVGVDELVARTGFCSQSLASMLLILELSGLVALHSGGRYQRVR